MSNNLQNTVQILPGSFKNMMLQNNQKNRKMFD